MSSKGTTPRSVGEVLENPRGGVFETREAAQAYQRASAEEFLRLRARRVLHEGRTRGRAAGLAALAQVCRHQPEGYRALVIEAMNKIVEEQASGGREPAAAAATPEPEPQREMTRAERWAARRNGGDS